MLTCRQKEADINLNEAIDKKRLKHFRALAKETALISKSLTAMIETVGPKTSDFGRIKSTGKADGSEIERIVERLIALETKYEKMIDCYTEERTVIEAALKILKPNERAVIRLYYFDCNTWEQTAEQLHYSYQHVHRLHGSALQKLKGKTQIAGSEKESI